MAPRFLEDLWTPGIAPRVRNFAPRWRSASSPSRFSFTAGDASNRWIRDSASFRASLAATETRKISRTCRETNLDSCHEPVALKQHRSWRVTVHWFLSETYKIVFDVEGKRGNFLFGRGRRTVHLKVRNHEGISRDCVNLQKMEVISYFEDVILLQWKALFSHIRCWRASEKYHNGQLFYWFRHTIHKLEDHT